MRQREILKDNQKTSKLTEPHQSTEQAQRTLSGTNAKISPKHNILKLLTRNKDKILKGVRGKKGQSKRAPPRNCAGGRGGRPGRGTEAECLQILGTLMSQILKKIRLR